MQEYPAIHQLSETEWMRRITEIREDDIASRNLLDSRLQNASPEYTPTNVVTDRSYDADATSVAELADVLGTLIADLQEKKVIG